MNNVFLATVFLATKMLLCFKKTRKTTKDIAETTKSGLRTVQCIIKTNYHPRKRCGWKKTLNDRGQRSLRRLVNSNKDQQYISWLYLIAKVIAIPHA